AALTIATYGFIMYSGFIEAQRRSVVANTRIDMAEGLNAAYKSGNINPKPGRYYIEPNLSLSFYYGETELEAWVFAMDSRLNGLNHEAPDSIPEKKFFYDPTNGTLSSGIIAGHLIFDRDSDMFLLDHSAY